MNLEKFESRLIGVHNVITNIYVRGDDAIRIAGVLTELRAMVSELHEPGEPAEEDQEQEAV